MTSLRGRQNTINLSPLGQFVTTHINGTAGLSVDSHLSSVPVLYNLRVGLPCPVPWGPRRRWTAVHTPSPDICCAHWWLINIVQSIGRANNVYVYARLLLQLHGTFASNDVDTRQVAIACHEVEQNAVLSLPEPLSDGASFNGCHNSSMDRLGGVVRLWGAPVQQ